MPEPAAVPPNLADRTNPRRMATRCPHCQSVARNHGRKRPIPTVEELYFQCTNLMCGHTWKAQLVFVYTISPSAMPAPGLQLPMAPQPGNDVLRVPLPANDPGDPPMNQRA